MRHAAYALACNSDLLPSLTCRPLRSRGSKVPCLLPGSAFPLRRSILPGTSSSGDGLAGTSKPLACVSRQFLSCKPLRLARL